MFQWTVYSQEPKRHIFILVPIVIHFSMYYGFFNPFKIIGTLRKCFFVVLTTMQLSRINWSKPYIE